jgi:YegS/Rv2252/BmrU family lipid kinase
MIQIILNPQSGRSDTDSLEKKIRKEFSGLSFDLECTSGPGHATQLARSASAKGAHTVVAVGGDGIVNEVLNGITGTGTTLGIIPTGTANDLARHLGISGNLSASCHLIRSRSAATIDSIEVNGRRFLTGGGIGLAGDVARTANRLRSGSSGHRGWCNFSGSKLYILAALIALATRKFESRPVYLGIDGRWIVADPFWIMVSNQPRAGRYFLVSPGAENNDGYFNICMAQNTRSRFKALATVIRTLAGKHEQRPDVSVFRSKEMIIQASEPLPFYGDGELLCESAELRIRIIPSSVRILVPGLRTSKDYQRHDLKMLISKNSGGGHEITA